MVRGVLKQIFIKKIKTEKKKLVVCCMKEE